MGLNPYYRKVGLIKEDGWDVRLFISIIRIIYYYHSLKSNYYIYLFYITKLEYIYIYIINSLKNNGGVMFK